MINLLGLTKREIRYFNTDRSTMQLYNMQGVLLTDTLYSVLWTLKWPWHLTLGFNSMFFTLRKPNYIGINTPVYLQMR